MTEVGQRNLEKFFAYWPKNLHGAWLYDFLGLYTFEERSEKKHGRGGQQENPLKPK